MQSRTPAADMSLILPSLKLSLHSAKSERTVACVLRIVEILVTTPVGCVRTKRDIFYMDTSLFEEQRRVDRLIDVLACTLQVPRDALGVTSSPKGLAFGDLAIQREDGVCISYAHSPTLLNREGIRGTIIDPVRIVVIVEKEAVFSLLWQRYADLKAAFPGLVVVTGRGYPDLITLQFIHRLEKACPEARLFSLVDFDPFGLDIALRYRCGSKLPFDQPLTRCDRLELLGIALPQLDRYCHQNRIDGNRQVLSDPAVRRLRQVIRQGESLKWAALAKAGKDMLACGFTAEIESIYLHSSDSLLAFLEAEIRSKLEVEHPSSVRQ